MRSLLRALASLLVLTTFACSSKPETPSLTAETLAAALSGGRSDPVCRNRGPRGEYLGPIPGAEHCQWPTVTRGAEFSTASAARDSVNGWTTITLERVFSDTARASVFIDSLNAAFVNVGLLPHRCATGGHRWQADGLVVQTVPTSPRPAGGHLLMLFAAAAIPSLLCPDAPPPAPRDPRARTS